MLENARAISITIAYTQSDSLDNMACHHCSFNFVQTMTQTLFCNLFRAPTFWSVEQKLNSNVTRLSSYGVYQESGYDIRWTVDMDIVDGTT